ncbi:radical SAM protein [Aestuariibaculum sp. M13]|uniref:radical SAM protein n=1 Tax=Aestuariibaculum sp. M13 TaxID=2967132 RepID=UPI002159E971|nr:radical SAM protein [Aestuariibaculum sp. M13]MCR8668316.1 radical SAM protein [Aestuariibaculum sp. M13]
MSNIKTIPFPFKSSASEVLTVFKKEQLNEKVSVISGLEMKWWLFRIRLTLVGVLISTYKSPIDWISGLKYLVQLRKKFLGNFRLKKMVRVDGKYYMGLYTPGWNDLNYQHFIVSELNYFKPVKKETLRFNHVQVAVTNKCALQCDHCYAWDTLNQRDVLSEQDLSGVIHKLQAMGTGQIHFTGGEPMLKVDILTKLLKRSRWSSNFWVNTSGFKLTNEKAKRLKASGLTGVFISLDHFNEQEHNKFRNYKDAYYWAIHGAKNAVANQLVVAFSICVTKDFVEEENLMKYMKLAKDMGVHFVQFLEPKAVGHYKGKDVMLSQDQIAKLESFYVKMNFSKKFLDFPIISYHGYYQRRQGCFSGGNRSMYVDAFGNINACTFCHSNSGNIFDKDFDVHLKDLSKKGCPSY